jgi:hypothetical protein
LQHLRYDARPQLNSQANLHCASTEDGGRGQKEADRLESQEIEEDHGAMMLKARTDELMQLYILIPLLHFYHGSIG